MIYIFIYMYSFSIVRSCARLRNPFKNTCVCLGLSPEKHQLPMQRVVWHTCHEQIKEKAGWEREARQNESEIQKAGLEVRINYSQASNHSMSSSLAYSMLCIS